MRRDVMVMIESCHVEINHTRYVKPECLVDHVECNAPLNLTWVFQKPFLVNVRRKEVILKLRCDRELNILSRFVEPRN